MDKSDKTKKSGNNSNSLDLSLIQDVISHFLMLKFEYRQNLVES